tara:strand:- start:5966 stop:7159 length:1194 start_codon:yes stop_codon:yes gene_type:complete
MGVSRVITLIMNLVSRKEKSLKVRDLSKRIVFLPLALVFIACISYAYAGEAVHSDIQEFINIDRSVVSYEDRQYSVTIKDVNVLVSDGTTIFLWGIEKISQNATVFNLKARNKLEKQIGDAPILCTIKSRDAQDDKVVHAQCINQNEEDLSLYLLQKGFVSADRTAIHGTIFEKPYLEAEQRAQNELNGVWASSEGDFSSSADVQSQNFMLGAFFLMAVFILALVVLGFFVVRGFKGVVDVQNRSLDLAMKERTLRDKEKLVMASMIKSELLENKTKIEAYLVIYEEMLQDFSGTGQAPRFQKTGEIVQKQPALSRSVFDGNTYKLDLFGSNLSSQVIHYYARIKSEPDYIEIAPDTPVAEVKKTIEAAVVNAKKLYDISDALLQGFIDNALARAAD